MKDFCVMMKSGYQIVSEPDRKSTGYAAACLKLRALGGIGNQKGKMSEEEIVKTIQEARDEKGRNRAGH